MFCNKPSGREDHKVKSCLSRIVGLGGQNSEDRRIWVVESDRTHRVKVVQIVLEWIVVAMPRRNIEWCVVLLVFESRAVETSNYGIVPFPFFY